MLPDPAPAVAVRDATDHDLPATLAIYNRLVADTTVTWAIEPETLDARQAWVARRRALGYPVLVADHPGAGVIGIGTYGDFRDNESKPGYRFTAELSIHVHADWTGHGIGRLLLDALTGRARVAGLHVLIAGVDGANEGSIRFFRRQGYVETARMPEVGHKFGRWLDLVLLQRTVDD